MRKAMSLTKRQIAHLKKSLPEWSLLKGDTLLKRSIQTNGYVDGLSLLARIVVHAEVGGHEPIIELRHNVLVITLTTDSIMKLSKKDVSLAQKIDVILLRRML